MSETSTPSIKQKPVHPDPEVCEVYEHLVGPARRQYRAALERHAPVHEILQAEANLQASEHLFEFYLNRRYCS
jgi:hypothetical protein